MKKGGCDQITASERDGVFYSLSTKKSVEAGGEGSGLGPEGDAQHETRAVPIAGVDEEHAAELFGDQAADGQP